ncbi:hypothetical protein Pelo_12951 [Pelomyxa schiedti]|nr:hypothetical protein Pelo_12951 [Pelomyxa schiedti]
MRRALVSVFGVFCLLVGAAVAEDQWSVLTNDIMTICMGIHFFSPQEGVVAGTQNVVGSVVKRTVDAGANWTIQHKEKELEMFMCLAFGDHTNGVTAGLGWNIDEISSWYTNDGAITWYDTGDKNLLAAYQDCEPVIGDPSMFAMAGMWVTKLIGGTGEGVAISHDAGHSWTHYDWKIDTEARYTSFGSSKVGWIAGGMWPESPADSRYHKRISQHFGIVKDENGDLHPEYVDTAPAPGAAYTGVIAKTEDGGETWQIQVNVTFMYFNEIFAINDHEVWAVGEGDTAGYVYHTSDGNNWEIQTTLDKTSLLACRFYDENEGWIGGSATEMVLDGGLWHTVDGGATWHLSEMKGYYVNQIDILDQDHVYATAFDKQGVTAVLEYLPA